MNERKAVKYHDRLVAALRHALASIDRECECANCSGARALLAEIEAPAPAPQRKEHPRPPSGPQRQPCTVCGGGFMEICPRCDGFGVEPMTNDD